MDHSHHRRAPHHYRDRDRSVSPRRQHDDQQAPLRYRNRPSPSRTQARSSQYLDRDREGYRSPSRSRSRSNSRSGGEQSPWRGGVPSRDVIMEGLPVDLLEQDVGFPSPLTFPAALFAILG
jgi:hypothetical protein